MTATSNIPITPFKPFCDASGFSINTDITYGFANFADIFVLVEATLKNDNLSNTRFETFPGEAPTYFSDLVYANPSFPTLTETSYPLFPGNSFIYYKLFRFRIPVSGVGNQSLSLPFSFAPNWFFGDVPWKVYMSASGSNDETVNVPSLASIVGDNILVGTLNFDAPYYPIVGSQNVSTHYTNLTTLFFAENDGKACSIMLLPDASGAPPTLTIDVPNLQIGFGQASSYGGDLYLSPGALVKVTSGHKLTMDYTNMYTCSRLSKGIVVEQGGAIEVINSKLADAEIAVNAKRGSTFVCGGHPSLTI